VDLVFSVTEGPQSVIASINYAGNERVSQHLVQEQVQLKPSEPLDLSALAQSRRKLYNTGAFSVVNITKQDAEGADAAEAPATTESSQDAGTRDGRVQGLGGSAATPEQPTAEQKPVDITVAVREVQPVQIRYGASYDTERGIGGLFDISGHNLLGGARQIGFSSRYDRQLHDFRLYLNQPALTYLPKTTFSVYFREELNPPTELTDPFDVGRKGISIQSEQRLQNLYVLTYGYRLERAHTLTPLGSVILDEQLTVSPVTATLLRETRDEVLDASRGAFLSQAFSYSPGFLGSDQPYIKYLGQYFHYFPLQAPQRKPFTNEIMRPRLVFATGVRLGLSRGIGTGQPVPRSERFFAGGSATMRGFEQNTVGPIGPDRIPLGGEAMLVINNELRVPIVSIFDGVVFADIGNVYPRVRDVSLTDIRESAGIGLRVRTPWVLLRGDWGFVLDPRPGEPRSRFYFSIGQAF
jgi:outer membrane protein assembly factor BamA